MTALATPPIVEQRMVHLQRANELRLARAAVRRDLRGPGQTCRMACVKAADYFLESPECLATMPAYDLLVTIRKFPRRSAQRALAYAQASEGRTVEELSERQRGRLAGWLRSYSERER